MLCVNTQRSGGNVGARPCGCWGIDHKTYSNLPHMGYHADAKNWAP